ncbi:MAG: TetR/AcrR family transcriptional regulator [bacterium]|nr:TetR/AcrR family transcriptional regulator [bacterium]
MTTTEKTQHNKELILTAAIKTLAKYGYAGTTVTLVAEAAGVSRGLLHYYFHNTEVLLAEATDLAFGPLFEMMGGLFDQAEDAAQLAHILTVQTRAAVREDPESMALMIEALAVARHPGPVQDKMLAMLLAAPGLMLGGLSRMQASGKAHPLVPLNYLPNLLTALLDGMGLQIMLRPELVEDDGLWEAMEQMIRTLIGGPATEK